MITAGASRVASGLLCLHAIAITPAGPMELVRSSLSIGLPCVTVRSAPAIVVSGPAQRSLTLWPVRSRSRLATLSIESSDSFVCLHCRLDCYRWSEPVPGRELHPLKSSAFSRRTITPNNGQTTIEAHHPYLQCGMGRAANNIRQGFAIQRAQRTERATRALSIAIPVFAYICR
jgi:hypothetical protein